MGNYEDVIYGISNLHSPVKDTEAAIIVNAGTRDFTFGEDFNPVIGVVGDHNSNEVTFLLPRYIDSHDISQCIKRVILWENKAAGTCGEYKRVGVEVSEDSETVKLTWLISGAVTKDAGDISYGILIEDYDEDNVLSYRWQTVAGTGLQVAAGVKRDVNPEEDYEEESVVVTYVRPKIAEVELLAANWVGESSPYSQVVTIDGVTPNTQVDLTPSAEEMEAFRVKELALVAENHNGVVTVYAIGQKPVNDYVMQVTLTLTEVGYE